MAATDAYEFHAALVRQTSLAACADLFREAIAPFGFDTFACGELDLEERRRNVFYVIGWPESWRQFYMSSGLIERDPIVDGLADRREPFTWVELRKDRKFPKVGTEALDLAAAHGWIEGLVVPMPANGRRIGLVSLAGRQVADEAAKRHLALLSICFHQQARARVVREGFPIPPAGLTEREMAAVRCIARGLSDAQVGRELGVAASTAHEFAEKAKAKLGTRTRPELIAVAVSLGIVDI